MTMKQTPPNTLNSIFTVAKHLKSHNRTAFYQRNQSFINSYFMNISHTG